MAERINGVDVTETTVITIDGKIDTIDTNVDTINSTTVTTDGKVDTIGTNVDTIIVTTNGIDLDNHAPFRFLGKSGDQSGNNWGIDGLTPFQAISGAGVYGADANDEAKCIGSDDTPLISGDATFDVHSIQIAAVSVNTEYKMRIIWGTDTFAAAIAADQFSELMFKFDAANPQQSAAIPVRVNMTAVANATKVWAQVKNATDNATCDFFLGTNGF